MSPKDSKKARKRKRTKNWKEGKGKKMKMKEDGNRIVGTNREKKRRKKRKEQNGVRSDEKKEKMMEFSCFVESEKKKLTEAQKAVSRARASIRQNADSCKHRFFCLSQRGLESTGETRR